MAKTETDNIVSERTAQIVSWTAKNWLDCTLRTRPVKELERIHKEQPN